MDVNNGNNVWFIGLMKLKLYIYNLIKSTQTKKWFHFFYFIHNNKPLQDWHDA
jgi:hypothetical protein